MSIILVYVEGYRFSEFIFAKSDKKHTFMGTMIIIEIFMTLYPSIRIYHLPISIVHTVLNHQNKSPIITRKNTHKKKPQHPGGHKLTFFFCTTKSTRVQPIITIPRKSHSLTYNPTESVAKSAPINHARVSQSFPAQYIIYVQYNE